MMDKNIRVWSIVNPPNSPLYLYADTIEQAVGILDIWAEEQLKDNSIISNAFGIEIIEDGEWCEADEWEHGYETGWYKEDKK